MAAARDRLLAEVVRHAESHGIADLSLRQIAGAVGTSHRMLLYHFGSREGLLVEVSRAVEAAYREVLAGISASLPPAEAIRTMWATLADPRLHPTERLFFELYGQALQGRPGTEGFLTGVVDSWVETALGSGGTAGASNRTADARLAVAVGRGLLLDLLATGDRAGVDAAMERFISLTTGRPEHLVEEIDHRSP